MLHLTPKHGDALAGLGAAYLALSREADAIALRGLDSLVGSVTDMDVGSPAQLGDGGAAVGAPTLNLLDSMIYVGTDEGVIYGVLYPIP